MEKFANETSIKFESDFDSQPFSTTLIVCFSIGGIIYEVCINPILLGSYLFEKFGVDSQRRTTINMLVSKIALSFIFNNLFSTPFAFYGLVLQPGGLNYWLGMWVFVASFSINYFACICGVDILILKILYATKWSTMALAGKYIPTRIVIPLV